MPINISSIQEVLRGGSPIGVTSTSQLSPEDPYYKAVIPSFLYNPPYGFPRTMDVPEVRRLAATPHVAMCVQTIVDDICGIDFKIVPKDKDNTNDKHIDLVTSWFDDPNVNKETWKDIQQRFLYDTLEINSGTVVKVFNRKAEFMEAYARNGATFLLNPDIFGTYSNRAEIIPTEWEMLIDKRPDSQQEGWMKEKPAYFQYGRTLSGRPMPFGTREIMYFQRNPRTDDIYGRSPVEILLKVIQMLTYGVEHNLDYFTDNNIPKGVFTMLNANTAAVQSFKDQWKEVTKIKDEHGDFRKRWHHMPILGTEGKFERIQFSAAEIELIAQQQWFTKIVWATFGVTPSELGFTEDSSRNVEVTQNKIYKKKAIYPLLRLIEDRVNQEIITEFKTGVRLQDGTLVKGIDDVMFQFDIYDLDDDIQKHGLYEIQIKNGIRTKNEIREEIGLDPMEGGDELKKESQFNPFDKNGLEDMMSEREKKKQKEKEEEKALVGKPEENPLSPGEFETISKPEKIERALSYLFKEKEKDVNTYLEAFLGGVSKLSEVKSIPSEFVSKVKSLMSLTAAGDVVRRVIRNAFYKGLSSAEQELGENFIPDQRAVDFLQDYSFDLVKDMGDEIATDLKAELSRGILNGEGITLLKARVSKVFDVSEGRANAIAQTETMRAMNAGHLEGYKAMEKTTGLKLGKGIDVKLDQRTSALCKRLDAKYKGKIPLGKSFEDATTGQEWSQPPFHVNCRTRLTGGSINDKEE